MAPGAIDPSRCVNCGACVPACPVSAVFAEERLPTEWASWKERNRRASGGRGAARGRGGSRNLRVGLREGSSSAAKAREAGTVDYTAFGMTLRHLSRLICDAVVRRAEAGKNYGVIVIPEGILEFINEIEVFIIKLNTIIAEYNTMHDRDFHLFFEGLLYFKAFRSLNIFQINSTKSRFKVLHGSYYIFWVFTFYFDIKNVNVSKSFK